jgi:hypothetical protein
VMIYTNPTKNWVWWATRTPSTTGCDDLHESYQKLGVMIYTNPIKTGCDDLHEPHQKQGVMI